MPDNEKKTILYLYKRLWPYIKPYWGRVLLAVLITIPVGALDAVIAYSLRPYMDIVMLEQSIKSAWVVPLAIVSFTALQGAFRYTSTYLNGWVGYRIATDLKQDLFAKLLTLETAFFSNTSSGNTISRFSTDVDLASSSIIENSKKFLIRFFSSIFLIAVLLYNSWQLAVVAVTVLCLTFIPLSFIKKNVKRYSKGMLQGNSVVINAYNETYSGNKIISTYNLSNYLLDRFKNSLHTIFKLNMKITVLNGWLSPVMHFLASIGIAFVIWYGSSLILNDIITMGAFISFITALIMLYNPIKGMGTTAVNLQNSLVSLSRIMELFDYRSKIVSAKNAVCLETINDSISFKNVCFEYEKGIPVLNSVNLQIQKGETVAFVGNSGGGKSTLAALIPRFYDTTSGQVEIDGINVKDIELASLRRCISVVFQDNFLFQGTIRDNIMMGNLSATDEELSKAVKDAYLEEFVADLKEGLDTEIGERGIMLSGGQKQRIAIARALLKDAPIVILDEATSALDNKSEALIQQAIDKLMKNKTVIVIAHRLSTIKNVDRIVVIEQGEILEQGSHEELIDKKSGVYRNLHSIQFTTSANAVL